MKKNSGITLIALVITIVIMLILATISVTMLSGDNSLINNAGEAKEGAEEKNEKDIINLAVTAAMNNNDFGELVAIELTDELNNNYGNMLTAKVKSNNSVRVNFKSGRKYSVDTDGNITKKENVVIADGLAIGSSVTYEPPGSTYIWRGKYATTSTIKEDGISTDDDVTLDSTSSGADRITTWRVFRIDEDNGEIQLVPTVTKTSVKLHGAPGYNNAVQLLDEACRTLYSDTSKEITAESIDIDDIEALLDSKKLQAEKDNYNQSYSHLVDIENEEYDQVASAYPQSNSRFPRIYEEEMYSVINGNKKISGLGLSFPGSKLYERDEATTSTNQTTDVTAIDGQLKAKTSIQPYQTYYYVSTSGKYKEYENVYGGYGGLLYNKSFWVASRCVQTYPDWCVYGVMIFSTNGVLDYAGMSHSEYYNTSSTSRSLFPVITLDSNVIEKNGNSFKVK